jgi:hypothetical protein
VVPGAVMGTCARAAPLAISRDKPRAASSRVAGVRGEEWKDADMLKLLDFEDA